MSASFLGCIASCPAGSAGAVWRVAKRQIRRRLSCQPVMARLAGGPIFGQQRLSQTWGGMVGPGNGRPGERDEVAGDCGTDRERRHGPHARTHRGRRQHHGVLGRDGWADAGGGQTDARGTAEPSRSGARRNTAASGGSGPVAGPNGYLRMSARDGCCPCSERWRFAHHVFCPADAR
jgi:hypothetical protein